MSSEESAETLPSSGESVSAEEVYPEEGDGCHASKAKRLRRGVTETDTDTSSSATELDADMWSMLDDHLLEKIFARLPFKSLFQVSSLSKTWRMRTRSRSFQSEVQNSSSALSWNAYAPLYVNHQKVLVGYESSSKQWHRLPSHSYLQRSEEQGWWLAAGAGSLLCWVSPRSPALRVGWDVFDVHVTNPLMRSSRQLRPRSKMKFPAIVQVSCEEGGQTYKVFLGSLKSRKTLHGRASIRLQIFDSGEDFWIMESYKIQTNCAVVFGGSAFINGVFYFILHSVERNVSFALISFDVKEKIWNEIPYLSLVGDEDQRPHQPLKFSVVQESQLCVCGSDVMLVVLHSDRMVSGRDCVYDRGISVLRLDLEHGLVFEVCRAPEEMWRVVKCWSGIATGPGDSIYVLCDAPYSRCMLYNVQTGEWHWVKRANDSPHCSTSMIPWTRAPVMYQPGLNPFQEV